jgi:hypothetical protein
VKYFLIKWLLYSEFNTEYEYDNIFTIRLSQYGDQYDLLIFENLIRNIFFFKWLFNAEFNTEYEYDNIFQFRLYQYGDQID